MAGSGGGQNAILSDQELLDTIGSTNLGNQLDNLWVVVATVAANDEECAISTLGYREQNSCDKGLAVVWLLEYCCLLS